MTRLRECREKANLSQKYVALTLGVAAPSVANWERGKTNPAHENIVRLADLYGVSVDYLLGRTNEHHGLGEYTIDDIDFALSGEIRDLTEDEKQDVLDYVRFKRAQKARQEAHNDARPAL